ncbi:hypothetical protein F5Y15DRAFT_430599 [Xylariaceae sp. FL0016]|nr:hypothetical protein F5Y15DRAFT_430599 [Xylariaceae sp. FL0016]
MLQRATNTSYGCNQRSRHAAGSPSVPRPAVEAPAVLHSCNLAKSRLLADLPTWGIVFTWRWLGFPIRGASCANGSHFVGTIDSAISYRQVSKEKQRDIRRQSFSEIGHRPHLNDDVQPTFLSCIDATSRADLAWPGPGLASQLFQDQRKGSSRYVAVPLDPDPWVVPEITRESHQVQMPDSTIVGSGSLASRYSTLGAELHRMKRDHLNRSSNVACDEMENDESGQGPVNG